MSYKKRQHFVPQTYLQSWAVDGELFSMQRDQEIGQGVVRKQAPKSVAKKNNLYSLPSTFFAPHKDRNLDLQELITENVLLKIWEDRWGNVRNLINSGSDLTAVLRDIKGFVIVQSFRTPKFLRLNRERIASAGNEVNHIEDAFHLAFLSTKGLTEYIENSVCEILVNSEKNNFITSDNPATHWIHEGEMFHHLNGIALSEALFKNPNYKILCPIHPRYFVVLTPNLGIDISNENKDKIWLGSTNHNTVKELNRAVEHGADKVLFAKDLLDFNFR